MVTVFRKVFFWAGTFLSFFPKKQRPFFFFFYFFVVFKNRLFIVFKKDIFYSKKYKEHSWNII